MSFEQSKFEYSKYTDDRKMELDEIRVGTEQDRIDRELDMRKYESDAADKRALLENDAALQKIESEKKSSIFKTIIYGLGILAGVALHLGDVNAEKELGYPMFVKPCCAGSSNGASKCSNKKELSFALMEAFQWDDKVLIEKSINAREVECSVTGNSVTYPADSDEQEVVAYIPGEIAPSHTFYDFDAKYNDPDGAKLLIPAELSEADLEKIRKTAVAAYKTLDAAGLARVDFFIDRDTKAVYLNEINTMPGFTSISMFPKLCEAAGLNFQDLVELLIQEGLARYNTKKSLNTSRN